MNYLYIDDSIHDRGDFIICGLVVADKNPNDLIKESLQRNGFNPETDEFKSGISYRKFPQMSKVRDDLKSMINGFCKFGLIVIPRNERKNIGEETIIGLKQFLAANKLTDELKIIIDSNFFENKELGIKIVNHLGLDNYQFYFEQDSIKERGIQLADLISHTCSTMLLESMGLINKKVKAGEKSGYEPDMGIELGFE